MTQEAQAELKRFKKDTAYLDTHYEELLEKYPEQWVAIYNQQVVGAAPDFDELLTELQEVGIPIERAVVEHLTGQEEVLILPS